MRMCLFATLVLPACTCWCSKFYGGFNAHFDILAVKDGGQWQIYFVIFGQVTTPLLKFMAEFVFNKSQRLTFDSSSPNGILLFREVSKLIVAYGTGVMGLPTPTDSYSFKYKGIWIMLTILTRGNATSTIFVHNLTILNMHMIPYMHIDEFMIVFIGTHTTQYSFLHGSTHSRVHLYFRY